MEYRYAFRLLEPIDAEAASTAAVPEPDALGATEHHVPNLRLPASIRHVLLPQWSNLFHHQDRRIDTLQLRVSSRSHLSGNFHLSFSFSLDVLKATWVKDASTKISRGPICVRSTCFYSLLH